MLLYLDNQQSIGPNIAAGASPPPGVGARYESNEKSRRARFWSCTHLESMRYTRPDVHQLARVLTGWSLGAVRDAGERTPGTF